MNCSQARNQYLTLSHPRKAPEPLREHVRACSRCEAWLRGAMEVDSALRHLPVPAAPRGLKAELLAQFRPPAVDTLPEIPASSGTAPMPEVLPLPSRRRERFWSKFGVGIALAAGLSGTAVWIGHRPTTAPTERVLAVKPADELLGRLLRQHVALASEATTPDKRLDNLTKLAAELRAESENIALIANADDMQTLARLYTKVIEKGVIPQAGLVRGPKQKAILADVQKQLEEAGDASERVAETRATRGSTGPLRQIAEASRKGDQHIRMLLKEGAS